MCVHVCACAYTHKYKIIVLLNTLSSPCFSDTLLFFLHIIVTCTPQVLFLTAVYLYIVLSLEKNILHQNNLFILVIQIFNFLLVIHLSR